MDRARLLMDLLGGRSPESFTADALSSKAHWRWDRAQHLEAFVLFEAAAGRAAAEGRPIQETSSRNRAATTLFLSGHDRTEALERLRAVLAHYRASPEQREDRHWVEWVWTSLLEHEAEARARPFEDAYRAAVADCAALDRPGYPRLRPHVERVLELARAADARSVVAELVARRRGMKPLPRALKVRLEELAAWCEAGRVTPQRSAWERSGPPRPPGGRG